MIESPFINQQEAEKIKNSFKKNFVFKTDHSVDETVTFAQLLDFTVKEITVLHNIKNNVSMDCCAKTNNITILMALFSHLGFMKNADIEVLLQEIHQFFKDGEIKNNNKH